MRAPVRVFLSHTSSDRRHAEALAEGLRAESFDVWKDEQILPTGDNWAAQIAAALDHANALVVLLSPQSVESESVRREIEYALSTARFQNRLVPVVIGQPAAWLEKAPWVLKKLGTIVSRTPGEAAKHVAEALRQAG